VLAPGTLSLLRVENGRTLIHTIVSAAPEVIDAYGRRSADVGTLGATCDGRQLTLNTCWNADLVRNRELVHP